MIALVFAGIGLIGSSPAQATETGYHWIAYNNGVLKTSPSGFQYRIRIQVSYNDWGDTVECRSWRLRIGMIYDPDHLAQKITGDAAYLNGLTYTQYNSGTYDVPIQFGGSNMTYSNWRDCSMIDLYDSLYQTANMTLHFDTGGGAEDQHWYNDWHVDGGTCTTTAPYIHGDAADCSFSEYVYR